MENIQGELQNLGNDSDPPIPQCFNICFIKIFCKWPDTYLGFAAFVLKTVSFRGYFDLDLRESYHIYNFFFSKSPLQCVVLSKRDQELGDNGSQTKKQQQEKLPNGAFILVSLGSTHL